MIALNGAMSFCMPKDLSEKNGMKIYAFADEASPTLSGQIAAMLRNGLDGVELRTVDGVNVSDLKPEQAREIGQRFRENGLCVWSLGSPMGKTELGKDDFNRETDRMKVTAELANILDCRNIRMFSFYLPKGAEAKAYQSEVIDRLGVWEMIAKDAGVCLCLENEKGLFGETPECCRSVLDALPSLYGVFDPANFVQVGIDPLPAWEILKDRIRYLHIKDALYSGDVVPAGCGDGKIAAITKAFLALGGTDVTMEPHLHDFGAYKSLEREGMAVELGKKYAFRTPDEAFDAAVMAFRELL